MIGGKRVEGELAMLIITRRTAILTGTAATIAGMSGLAKSAVPT